MKKILLSVAVIAIVAIGAIGATRAFFSDTETSTGNTFTAGAIDLKIDSEQHYNNAICVDGKWELFGNEEATNPQYPVIGSDCGGTWGQDGDGVDITSEKFFAFNDIKPGDEGENTVSIHVSNNDAYVCVAVTNLASADNDQTEPESEVDDDSDEGELDEEMIWKIWRDDGDNIWQSTEEVLAYGAPTAGVLALYDSNSTSLTAGETAYLGVSWELPWSSGNETQTDSLTGDISFYTVQSRNNDGFKCSDWEPVEQVEELIVFELVDQDGQHDDNETNDQPYVTWVINGDNIDFTFHNPTGIASPFPFEYRIDDEVGAPIGGITGVTIPSGPYSGNVWGEFYNFVSVGSGGSTTVNLTGTSKIQVRLVIGPERDYDFDWITFEAL
jgi:predicted ribosomally synthesized peptide with SipW-like signal peptide